MLLKIRGNLGREHLPACKTRPFDIRLAGGVSNVFLIFLLMSVIYLLLDSRFDITAENHSQTCQQKTSSSFDAIFFLTDRWVMAHGYAAQFQLLLSF